jgi:ketosteroid isomerase-like protein
MSEENVEVVRAAIDAWNRGDWDAALRDAASDFEYDLSRALGPFRGVYGRGQVQQAWADFTEGLTSAWIEAHEFPKLPNRAMHRHDHREPIFRNDELARPPGLRY